MNFDFECIVCRDKGRKGGCPKCGRERPILANEFDEKVSRKDLDDLSIPLHYYKNRWDKNILINDRADFSEDDMFINYVKQLDACYSMIDKGELPNISVLVTAPAVYAKTTWAYSCIIRAREYGYNVVPIIDTAQMRRMLVINSERPTKENTYLGYSLSDYLDSDMLFLLVNRGTEYVYAYETIVNILDIRSRRSKPTLIISDKSLRELSAFDKNKNLYNLTQGGSNVDPYRYAVLIEFNRYNI